VQTAVKIQNDLHRDGSL